MHVQRVRARRQLITVAFPCIQHAPKSESVSPCAPAWLCAFALPPCLVLFVQGEKLKVQTHSVPRCLFWGNITTGISHSSKKAV